MTAPELSAPAEATDQPPRAGLRDLSVVIVGATSGIGRATALAFARSRARLVLAARADSSLADVAAECRAAGASVHTVVADATEEEQLRLVAWTAQQEYGRIDVWVHTAAVIAYGRFESIPADVFRRVVEVEVFGVAAAARQVLPIMREQKEGTFVVFGSLLGVVAVPYMSPYVTGKWAIRGLMRSLVQENRDVPGVRICHVMPGSVDTPVYVLGANYSGRVPQPPPPVDQPERLAEVVLDLVQRPRPEVLVGARNWFIRAGFLFAPRVYDRLAAPLMQRLGFTAAPAEDTTGNVFQPTPDSEAVYGPPRDSRGAPSRAVRAPGDRKDDSGYDGAMATVRRHVTASPDRVWSVLADGWVYPTWVVGASRIRAVDAGWPAPGTKIHHSVGVWPLVVNDDTEVVEAQPQERLVLRARGWPFGEAQVEIELRPDGTGTEVVLHEKPAAGPGGVLMANPAGEWLMEKRNVETLERLAAVAEGRGGGSIDGR